jgi:hypothetical protein
MTSRRDSWWAEWGRFFFEFLRFSPTIIIPPLLHTNLPPHPEMCDSQAAQPQPLTWEQGSISDPARPLLRIRELVNFKSRGDQGWNRNLERRGPKIYKECFSTPI